VLELSIIKFLFSIPCKISSAQGSIPAPVYMKRLALLTFIMSLGFGSNVCASTPGGKSRVTSILSPPTSKKNSLVPVPPKSSVRTNSTSTSALPTNSKKNATVRRNNATTNQTAVPKPTNVVSTNVVPTLVANSKNEDNCIATIEVYENIAA
jgi:hypothetical protein